MAKKIGLARNPAAKSAMRDAADGIGLPAWGGLRNQEQRTLNPCPATARQGGRKGLPAWWTRKLGLLRLRCSWLGREVGVLRKHVPPRLLVHLGLECVLALQRFPPAWPPGAR